MEFEDSSQRISMSVDRTTEACLNPLKHSGYYMYRLL
jgi:hypothetical protein